MNIQERGAASASPISALKRLLFLGVENVGKNHKSLSPVDKDKINGRLALLPSRGGCVSVPFSLVLIDYYSVFWALEDR